MPSYRESLCAPQCTCPVFAGEKYQSGMPDREGATDDRVPVRIPVLQRHGGMSVCLAENWPTLYLP